ncbi:MAG TPA: M3 family metallopeptidase [Candidatus Limnocylindria bacterium]|nr:M3 family metallopeptidase [Candidatus Limnocylindria bacterium]
MGYDYSTASVDSVRRETDAGLTDADALVDEAVTADEVSFRARVAPLELANARLTAAYGRGAVLGQAHTDAAVRDAGSGAEERITKWRAALPFREDLYRSVRAVAEAPEPEPLTVEQARVLFLWMRDFRRAGHGLEPAARAELEQLRARLVELEIAFNRNINEYEDAIELTRDELAGMPDEFVERLSPGSRDGTLRVSLDYPEVYPFIAQSPNRTAREALFRKHWRRSVDANRPLMEEALRLRQRAAELLGHSTWAHYAIEVKMAETPEAVAAFYASLVPRLTPVRDRELGVLTERFHRDGYEGPLQAWDWSYYDEQMRRSDFGVDANLVAEYLPMAACLEGMFALTGEVLGLDFRRMPEARGWHPSVELYEIRDRPSGEPIATFYADWFPREGKFGHAAAFPLVVGHRRADGGYEQPVSAILANFTPPAGDRPSLLQHNELETLFHEFGHILHMSLTRAEYARTSGSETEIDFVEAPSQIMEHWGWDPSVLARFARHYRTGEPIPAELVRQLKASRYVNIGLKTLIQVFYGQLDLGLHNGEAEPDLDEVLRAAHVNVGLPYPEGTFLLSGFGHPMGGYDAGYYGYLWSEVIGDDLFGRFTAEGVTSPAVGADYRREILEPNGTRPAAELVRAFLGRAPTPDTWLRLRGMAEGA